MAISLDPLPPSPAPPTLLATLRAFTRALETRRALQAELDSALSSFLSGAPEPLAGADALSAAAQAPSRAGDTPPAGLSPCAAEALRPPSQPELEQALTIGFGGLVELKEEVRVLQSAVGERWGRRDLEEVVRRIEGWEIERLRATLERDQMRRLSMLQPELDFTSSIAEKNALRDSLAAQVQEEVQEIHAEIAELSAAEAEEGAEAEGAAQ
ncbi:hypothetical protein JCM10450v2_003862 [Rhodotorula kratochvilovae]